MPNNQAEQGAHSPASSFNPETLFAEANIWFFRMRAEDFSDIEQQDFAHWLTTSPEHFSAWSSVQELFLALEEPAKAIRQQEQTSTVSPKIKTENTPTQRRFHGWPIITSLIACACILIIVMQSTPLQYLFSDYRTTTGEQRRIELADGSHLLLNTDSAVNVNIKDHLRQVDLLRGEVYFEVAHVEQKPFKVLAGRVETQVTGTAFNVTKKRNAVIIAVSEGQVQTRLTEAPKKITILTPGMLAVYSGQEPARVEKTDLEQTLAWRQGKLIFVQTPLSQVVAEINRYRPGKIIITDQQLKDRPVTAVFFINNLNDAVNALEKNLLTPTRRLTDYLVLMG